MVANHPNRPEDLRRTPPAVLAGVRLADTAAYSSMCATWGQLGGLTTFYRYGSSWYALLALKRWGRISAEDLEAARPLR